MKFTPSKYQTAIFNRMSGMFNGDPNLAVIARAGTGKTTTIVEGLNYVPKGLNAIFCAFNKSIQVEMGNRLPDGFTSRTFHSLGLSNLMKYNPKSKVHTYKAHDIFAQLVPEPPKWEAWEVKQEWRAFKSEFIRAFSFARNNLIDFDSETAIWNLLDAIDCEGFEPRIAPLLPEAHKLDLMNDREWDFDNMISWAIYQNLTLEKFDYMAVDEAQDLNPAQIELVIRSLNGNGKATVIGDPRQSIYGFRGADEYAMDKLIAATQSSTLPLPITYRCPIKVVQKAKSIVPDLEWRENAPEGVVDEIQEYQMYSKIQPKDMILCRINAPLAGMAFSFLSKGIKATIMGKDLGKQLANIAKKATSGAGSMQDVYSWLGETENNEIQKVLNNQYIRNPEGKIDRIRDKYNTLVAIADNCTTPYEFPYKTESLFDDRTDGIVLSTVHKAKGLEADKVFIIEPHLMPHPLAKSDAAQVQEQNLQYVAWTRAKQELYFVR